MNFQNQDLYQLYLAITGQSSTGSTPYKLISAATINATSLKAAAGKLFGIQAANINAAVRYLKIYDKASAPNPAADTPKMVIAIPGSTTGAGNNVPINLNGIQFSLGIAFTIVTGIADTDATAVAANEIVVNLQYL